MPYNLNGDYIPTSNVSPLPAGYSEYKYATAEAAAAARSGGAASSTSAQTTITSAQATASSQMAISIRISGFVSEVQ